MTSLDRRTFLARGVQASAALAVGGAVGLPAAQSPGPRRRRRPGRGRQLGHRWAAPRQWAHRQRRASIPIGVDPDDCAFAWTLRAAGRSAVQRAYRIVVQRQAPAGPRSGTAAPSSPPGRPSSTTAGPRCEPDTAYTWTVRVRGATGGWSPASARGRFATALGAADLGRRLAAARGVEPAAQPRHLSAPRGRPPARSPAAGHRLRGGRPHLPALHQRLAPRPRAELLLSRRAVLPLRRRHRAPCGPGHPERGGCAPPLVRPRSRPTGLGARPAAPALRALRRRSSCRASGTDASWKEHAAEWLPAPQRNADGGDFVEWVDGRAHPTGWNRPGFDDRDWVPLDRVRGPLGTGHLHRTPSSSAPTSRTGWSQPVSLHTLPNGSIVADFGAIYAARLRVRFAHGQAGRTDAHAGRLPARPRWAGLDPARHPGVATSPSPTSPRDGDQTFEALTYLGFRYLQIDQPGERMARDQMRPSPRTRPCPRWPWPPSRPRTACSTRCGSSMPARASTAATSSSSTRQPARRGSSSGTPPTSPRPSCAPTGSRT